MKRVWIMAAALALAGMATVAQAQEEYALQLQYKHPEAGEGITLHTVAHVVGTLQGLGVGGQKMTQKVEQWMRFECLAIDDDGNARIRMNFQRFVMDMSMGGRHVKFDSAAAPGSQPAREDPTQAQVRKALAGMLSGKGLTATVTPEGKCVKVEGVEEWFEGTKEMPGGEQMGKMLRQSLNENAMADEWFGHVAWLPKKPVRIGETWSSERRIKMGPFGEGIAKSRNKLLGVETVDGRRIARIGQTMNMELVPDPAGMGIPGAENMKMKMTCLGGTGTRLWDIDKAQVVRVQESSPIEFTLEFGSTTQPSTAIKMTQKFNYTTTVELVGDELGARLLPGDTPKATPAGAAAATTQPTAAK